ELPMRNIVWDWLDEQDVCDDIPKIAVRGDDGEVRRTRMELPRCGELVHPPSLDTVPDLLDRGAGTFLTQASRGCSWGKCTYCTVSSFRQNLRWEPLPWERTRGHLELLASHGIREFEFCDDEFMGGREPEHLD